MLSRRIWEHLLAALVLCSSSIYAESPAVFSMPDSTLLFGTYDELRIVTPDRAAAIKPPIEVPANHGYFGYPSISPKGNLIAWGFAVGLRKDRPEHPARFALGVFSLTEQKWTTYGDFDEVGNPVFSPDGSKIAFIASERSKSSFYLFDVATGDVTKPAYLNGIPQKLVVLRDRKSTRLNSSHIQKSRMPSSA